MNHYVYRITSIVEDKYYYGVRTCKVEPKEDLGKKYFSSSTDKIFIKDQKENPQNYKYKVLKRFPTRKEAISYEIKLHQRFDVGAHEKFYNKVKQTSDGWDTSGVEMKKLRDYTVSEETKEKLRQANLGKKQSKETIAKRAAKLKGREVSEETRRKIGLKNSQKVRTEAEKAHLAKINTGKTLSEETKRKISEKLTGREVTDEFREKMRKLVTGRKHPVPRKECPCGRKLAHNVFKRHQDKCEVALALKSV